MARRAAKPKPVKTLEQTLWDAADKLRGNQEPSEYKHVVLGLVFLKYISDRFEERRKALEAELVTEGIKPERLSSFLEDRDEYASHNVFWVPEEARWDHIRSRAKLPSVGQDIDAAMDLIEKENPSIRGVLPRNYGRDGLDKRRLGELVDLIGSIGFSSADDHGADDVLGRVYEYFLGQFAGKETGKDAGAFYTPRWVVKLLVEMLEPYKGRVYDPACGSGGMFVQSAEFVKAHGGKRTDLSVYGQEYTDTTWKLAKMNLALRGIEADLGTHSADSFTEDLHPDLRADFVIANPPFNVSDWWDAKLADDPRWQYGTPPQGNANFAWVQHFIHHLSPRGTAGFVLANGALSSRASSEAEIRERLIRDDLVDCIVSLPDRLFFNTAIPVSLWFVSKGRHGNGHRARQGEVLFIDARSLGYMETRRLRALSDDDIGKIASTYHAWRSSDPSQPYVDVEGFARAASVQQILEQDCILAPSRYVGSPDDGIDPNAESSIAMRAELAAEAQSLLTQFDASRSQADIAMAALSEAWEIEDWQEVRIGEVAKVVGGGTPSSKDEGSFGGDIPWITPKDMTGHQGRYISCGARSLSDTGLSMSSAKLLPKDAVLVSSRAPIGLVAIAAQPLATNQGIRSLIFDDTQDPVFWYYLLRQSTHVLDAHANGSTFREISGGNLAKLVFEVPSLSGQKKIAETLSRIDDLIEHSLTLNSVLGQISLLGSRYAVRRDR